MPATCSLNPFEFRAGIYLKAKTKAEKEASLNPFEFRAGIYFTTSHKSTMPPGLNPFEFRAGIYLHCAPTGVWMNTGLNPFEFRAGIYLGPQCPMPIASSVLIPLNSGLVFTSEEILALQIAGLNPFEFRAGIYLVDYRTAA